MTPSGQFYKAKKMIDSLVGICVVANPLVSAERWRMAFNTLSARAIIALRMMADANMRLESNADYAKILRVKGKTIENVWLKNDTFCYLLETLTVGFNKRKLPPLMMEVIVNGLDRRYPADITNKETGEKLHCKGDRVYDSTTVGLLREAKTFIGVATEINANQADMSEAEKRAQDKDLKRLLDENPELARLAAVVKQVEAEAPKKKSTSPTAVASDGSLTEEDE
jgi:hypothetical protein